MTRYFAFNDIPLARIDSSGFMVGLTGTCYYRGTAAWKGMLLLSLARGGWANTYYGNLELIDADKAEWFARAQALFYPFQALNAVSTFGGMPGLEQPYGFLASTEEGGLITVVNPTQKIATLKIPLAGEARILFQDIGFEPVLGQGIVTLGPEQMALIGFGRYAAADFDLGLQLDVPIPTKIQHLETLIGTKGEKAVTATITAPGQRNFRILLRQQDLSGIAKRSHGGAPPAGRKMAGFLAIEVRQGTKSIPVVANYDKAIWSGLSWAVGEIFCKAFEPSIPLIIRCSTQESEAVGLVCEIHQVDY